MSGKSYIVCFFHKMDLILTLRIEFTLIGRGLVRELKRFFTARL